MKIIELKRPEYVGISHGGHMSYGGDQNWFSVDKWMSREYLLHKWGCGAVAAGDLFLYLAKSSRRYGTASTSLARIARPVIDWEDYKLYMQHIASTFTMILPGSGMNGFALAAAVRRYCLKYRIPMTIAWKGFMDDQQMLQVMRKMLREDLPVILSIGPNTPLVFMKRGVPFYTMNERQEFINSGHLAVHSHFVTVTGIIGRKHKQVMLQISSWGKKYYIDYQEYRAYVNEKGDELTSSLLYLSKEDGTPF